MIAKTIPFIKKLLLEERTPTKLAHASCFGLFIAFSPFIGFHWLMTIVFAWAFRLNIAVVYAVAHLNNPLTMIPIYLADYKIGDAISQRLGINLFAYNPSWMNWLNMKLACLQIPNLSLWTFIIGGNVLSIVLGIISYPFFIRFYKRILTGSMR